MEEVWRTTTITGAGPMTPPHRATSPPPPVHRLVRHFRSVVDDRRCIGSAGSFDPIKGHLVVVPRVHDPVQEVYSPRNQEEQSSNGANPVRRVRFQCNGSVDVHNSRRWLRQGNHGGHVGDEREVQVVCAVLNIEGIVLPADSSADRQSKRFFDGGENLFGGGGC